MMYVECIDHFAKSIKIDHVITIGEELFRIDWICLIINFFDFF